MAYSVYILKSKIVDKYYIGQTKHLELRIDQHNSKKAKWTKRYQPWVLIYFEEYETRSEALKREKYFKSLKGIEKFVSSIQKEMCTKKNIG